jgi:YVTN family beta-propeller protein
MNRAEKNVTFIRELMRPANPVPASAFSGGSAEDPGAARLQQRGQSAGAAAGEAGPGDRGLLLVTDRDPGPPGRGPQRWLRPAAAAAAVIAIGIGAAALSPRAARPGPVPRGGSGRPVVAAGQAGPAARNLRPRAVIAVRGMLPFGVAVDQATDTVYVANTFGPVNSSGAYGTVSVISGKTGRVTATVPVQAAPHGLAADPQTDRIYVANAQADDAQANPAHGSVSVISGAARKVIATVRVGRLPMGVTTDPKTSTVYIANENGNSVSVISEATNTVTATIRVGQAPLAIAANPQTGLVYVANIVSNTVSVISVRTNQVKATIRAGNGPSAVAVDPVTDTVYVANAFGDSVSVINGTTNKVTRTIAVGHQPQGVTVDPRTGTVYVAQFRGNSVAVIEGKASRVTATIPVGKAPQQLAFDTVSHSVYVANMGSDTVSVLGP